MLSVGPASAAVLVATPATFGAVFAAAHNGDTLQLVGTFSGARLANRSFSQVVTFDASRAVFTNMLQLTNVSGVRISGGRFDLTGDAAWTKGLLVNGGKNIYSDHMTVIGSGTQWGVSFVGTQNAQVTFGNFTGLNSAVLLGGVNGGFLAKNRVFGSTSDGIDIANSHRVTATANSCANGAPVPGAHPDCIQLWSVTGNPLQSDIVVSGNTATGPTQGFTSFQAGGGGERLQFINNIVETSFPQGIACLACNDSTITGNRVSTLPGSQHQTVINFYGNNNIVANNIVSPYSAPRSNSLEALSEFEATGDDGLVSTFDEFNELIAADNAVPAAATVPEPAAWTLLVAGFAGVGVASRRAAGRRRYVMA